MKNVFFIYPNPNRTNPRGIRVKNIMSELQSIAPQNNYELLSFSDSLIKRNEKYLKINSFNLIYLFIRYSGLFKYGRKIIKKARLLDPYLFVHFIIKWDLKIRLKSLDSKDCVFVVVVSPFSNYSLIPWLRKEYPNANLICDIGDPLYQNSARLFDEKTAMKIEFNALTKLDGIIVTNEDTSSFFVREYNLNPSLLFIIPQGVDISLIEHHNRIIDKQDNCSLVYAGSFYKDLRSPKNLFDFIASQKYFKLYIFGNSKGENVPHIIYEGSREQSVLFKEIQKKDIIVYIDNKYGMQTSGKIYEVLSFKKPILFILGKENSSPYLLAKEYPNVFFAEDNVKSIENSLNKILSSEEIDFVKDIEIHTWKNRANCYINIINQ